MNSIEDKFNRFISGVDSGQEGHNPVFFCAAIFFSIFHLSSGIITAVRFGVDTMSIAGILFGLLYAGLIFSSKVFQNRVRGEILLMLFLFIDVTVLWFISGGTIGGVLYLAMPASAATILLSRGKGRAAALASWLILLSALFAVEYYYPEHVSTGFIFFDSYFDTLITFLFSIASAGSIMIVYSCSRDFLKFRYLSLSEHAEENSLSLRIAEEKSREFDGFSIDYPVRVTSELSNILEYLISPLDSVIEGEFGNRVSRRMLISMKANSERIRQYVLNMKYLALMEHGITEPLSAPADLDAVISESSTEFHDRFGTLLPEVRCDVADDRTIGSSDPLLLRRAFVNILYACSIYDKSPSVPSVFVDKSIDTATIIFTPGKDADTAAVADTLEILLSDTGDPFAVYREKWLCLTVAKKIIELHNGSIIAYIPQANTVEGEEGLSVTVRLPVI